MKNCCKTFAEMLLKEISKITMIDSVLSEIALVFENNNVNVDWDDEG